MHLNIFNHPLNLIERVLGLKIFIEIDEKICENKFQFFYLLLYILFFLYNRP